MAQKYILKIALQKKNVFDKTTVTIKFEPMTTVRLHSCKYILKNYQLKSNIEDNYEARGKVNKNLIRNFFKSRQRSVNSLESKCPIMLCQFR